MAQDDETTKKVNARPTVVAEDNANAGGTVTATAQKEDASVRPNAGADTGAKQIAMNITNEYGEPIYIGERLNTGAPQKAGAGANERFAQANYHNPTPEEIEKQEKEYRNKRFWAALNDGIASLSNLYFTTQYAPNSFDPTNLGTDKVRERYDKLKKDRDDQKDKWFNAVMNGRKMDNDIEAGKRASRLAYYQLQQQAKDKAADRARADAQFKANLAWQKEHAANQDQLARDKMAQDQQQHKENLSAKYYQINKSGSGNNGEYYAYDEDGNIHTFTKADAAEKFAWDHGTHGEYDILNTSDTDSEKFDKKGNSKESSTSTTTTKKKGWYPKNPKQEDTKSSKQEEDIDKTTYKKKH